MNAISEPASDSDRPYPQAGQERLILPQPVSCVGGQPDIEARVLSRLKPGTVLMMGDHAALPRLPDRPRLLDFFRDRFTDITARHLLASGQRALADGHEEEVVMACLLHDIANGCLLRSDHGYWGAQLIAPYVSEQVAWAVKYHQALRYYADESVGYSYPESYRRFFGPDYQPPEYIRRDAEYARGHRWYMSSRLITLYDIYFFERTEPIDPEIFTDIIGRHFKQPEEGLGFDGSPVAHMWRTMIWPNNSL